MWCVFTWLLAWWDVATMSGCCVLCDTDGVPRVGMLDGSCHQKCLCMPPLRRCVNGHQYAADDSFRYTAVICALLVGTCQVIPPGWAQQNVTQLSILPAFVTHTRSHLVVTMDWSDVQRMWPCSAAHRAWYCSINLIA